MLTSLLTTLALAYGGLAALLFVFQDNLAYYPQIGREIQSTPRDHRLDYKQLTLTTADGERLRQPLILAYIVAMTPWQEPSA